jgi:hypothetical protein
MSKSEVDDGLRGVMTFKDRSEADDFILDLPKILRELKLDYRFDTVWAPRVVTERWQRGRNARISSIYYEVCMRDKFPDAAPPNITANDISAAWRRVKYLDQLPDVGRQQSKGRGQQYEALGQRMTIAQWARAIGVTPSALSQRLKTGQTMEDAIKAIALRKSA